MRQGHRRYAPPAPGNCFVCCRMCGYVISPQKEPQHRRPFRCVVPAESLTYPVVDSALIDDIHARDVQVIRRGASSRTGKSYGIQCGVGERKVRVNVGRSSCISNINSGTGTRVRTIYEGGSRTNRDPVAMRIASRTRYDRDGTLP